MGLLRRSIALHPSDRFVNATAMLAAVDAAAKRSDTTDRRSRTMTMADPNLTRRDFVAAIVALPMISSLSAAARGSRRS